MSNYPPGVTGNERQIAGEVHFTDCPLHEDYKFSDEAVGRLDPYEVKQLVEAALLAECHSGGHSHWPAIRDALRPFLWLVECCCQEIDDAGREEAELRKAEERAGQD